MQYARILPARRTDRRRALVALIAALTLAGACWYARPHQPASRGATVTADDPPLRSSWG